MTSRAVEHPASIEYSTYRLAAVTTSVFVNSILGCVFVHYAVHLGRMTARTRLGLRTLA
jgi:hypothetical protein